jgi:exodeoxyribonuclease VIII
MDRVTGMANSLNSHSLARPLFQDGTPEVTLVWKCQLSATDASRWVLCKGRIDWLCNTAECGGILVDLKTTADISRFHEKWAEYGYHRQAAMYVDGYKALTGLDTDPDYWIVAVEKEPPFSVMAAVVSPIAIEAGRAEYRYLVSRVYEAMQNHRFPGPVSPPSWVLPAWYRPLDFQRFYDPGTWSWAKN